MKKLIAGIIALTLAVVAVFGLTACNDTKPTTTMTNWGAIKSIGGAVAETENYLYYINGIGASADDNTFGNPIKGALMAVDKSSIGTDELKTEIVVPKLFIASDYDAGVYLFGEGEETYVYYATPSVEKDASGKVASNSLSFMKTKLDGSNTETFFTIKGLSSYYRIAENNGVVYIVYFESDEEAIKVFDTSTKTHTVIAEVNAETTEAVEFPNGTIGYQSLSSYRFIPNGESVQVIYSMTVYAENYYEDKAETEGEEYVRAEESFNAIYTYTVGDSKNEYGVYGKMLKCGEEKDITYNLGIVEDGYFFYEETTLTGKTTTYALSLNNIDGEPVLIKNSDYVAALIVIESLDEIYFIDSEKEVVYKTSLIQDDTKIKEMVITGNKASSLLYKNNGYMYYFSNSSKLARIKLEANAVEESVSSSLVTSTWYAPQIFTINGNEYIFYCNSSTEGSSYVNFVKLNAEAVLNKGADADDDSDDYYELQGQTILGKMTDKDAANVAISLMESIPSTNIEYEVEDGVVILPSVIKARAEYDKLSKESKEYISDALLKKLENAERAQTLANYYYKLNNYKNYVKMSDENKEEFAKAYEEAKKYRKELINEKDSAYTTIRDFITDDIKINFQEAKKILEPEEK